MRIFIAGPYGDHNTQKVIDQNVRNADSIGRVLTALGHFVFVPHKMSRGWEKDSRIPREQCLELDKSFLKYWAEGLFRLSGHSPGADGEEAYARELGLPIFRVISDTESYPKSWSSGGNL